MLKKYLDIRDTLENRGWQLVDCGPDADTLKYFTRPNLALETTL